ncbi:MAG: hypothetical protein VYC34_11810 [Planctomycetota bacterium]|nr:hypothetical protein [Planctomycetota bacterium]
MRGLPLSFASVIALAAASTVNIASAAINLELRPQITAADPGDIVELGLYAAGDAPDQSFAALEVIFAWTPTDLHFLGISSAGAISLLSSSLPNPDPYNLNESSPPADGDALYVAFAGFGAPAVAPPSGALITTLRFQVLATSGDTQVEFLEAAGSPEGETIVFDGEVPNLDVTGALSGALINIASTCPADLDGDGAVGAADLAALLGAWGMTGPADFDGGGVTSSDLGILLGSWGPCP